MTKLRVYVSSTYEDLKDFRAKVIEGLRRGGYELVTMEDYPAFDQRPLAKCLADVASCQIYVGILAKRYGHVPTEDNPDKRSITEREYLQATQSRLPRLVFQLDPETPWSEKFDDRLAQGKGRDRGKNIERFRAHVGKEHGIRYFSGPDELASLVLEAISAWEKERPATLPGSPSALPPSAPTFRWPPAGDFAALIAAKREGFSGREWLFAEVEAWAANPASRALLIRADYGVGKSAFIAELVARNPGGAVAAWHFCQHDTRETLRPGAFVRNLAGRLRDSLPAYREAVEARPELQERLDKALEDPGSAFEAALLNPLATLAAPPAPRLILIDALDEALEVDADEARRVGNLVALLSNKASRLPPWLRLVVTARNNPEVISRLLGAFTLTQIDAEGADNRDDLYAYAQSHASLDPVAAKLGAAGKSADWLARLLRDRAGGKFLYVARALRDLKEKRLTLAQAGELPPGMDGFYRDAFERRFEKAGRAYDPYRALLGLLCALREPVSAGPLAELLGCEARHIQAAHALLPDFIVKRQGGYTFEHFSIAEWLSRENDEGFPRAGPYAVDLAAAEACIHDRALQRIQDGNAHQFDYLVRHLAHHLPDAAERRAAFTTLMQDYRWLRERLRLAGVDALLGDCRHLGDSEFGRLLAACLRNSAHVLRREPEQLAAQVLGRLSIPAEEMWIANLLTRVRDEIRQAVKDGGGEAGAALLPASASLPLNTALDATLTVHGSPIFAIAALPDGRVASASCDGDIWITDPSDIREPEYIAGHAFDGLDLISFGDGRLAFANQSGNVIVWDVIGRRLFSALESPPEKILVLAPLSDGRLALGGVEGRICIWDPANGCNLEVLGNVQARVLALLQLPDGQLAAGTESGAIHVWSLATCTSSKVLKGHNHRVVTLACLTDRWLASGSLDGTICLWKLNGSWEPETLNGYCGIVLALTALPDGRLAAGSHDGFIRLWAPANRQGPETLGRHGGWLKALAVLPNGRLAAGCDDGAIRIWNAQSSPESERFQSDGDWVWANTIDANGRLAACSENGTVRLWDLTGHGGFVEWHFPGQLITACALLPDGRVVATGAGKTWLCDGPEGGQTEELDGLATSVLALLPNQRLGIGGLEGSVSLWSVVGRHLTPAIFDGYRDEVTALCLLPDGRLASADKTGRICVWDLAAGRIQTVLEGHSGKVYGLVPLPDERLASCSADETIRVWSLAGNSKHQTIETNDGWVRALAILPDGRLVAGTDRHVAIWRPDFQRICASFATDARVGRVLTLPSGQIVAGDASGRLHFLELIEGQP